MQELGMKQRVFGSHRTLGDDLIKLAGPAAEGYQAVYPYDPSSADPAWTDFVSRYQKRYSEKPDHFAALAYDQMQILLKAICAAGLNRAMIRDVLYGFTKYRGVTGNMSFDPNDKQIRPLYLGTVHNGQIEYRVASMEKVYARVGEDPVSYNGPSTPKLDNDIRIAVFGPHATEQVNSVEVKQALASHADRKISLIGVSADQPWGKASSELVRAVYDDKVVAIISLDRNSSHLSEQIGVKAFVPVLAVSSDKTLTSINIPWIFRLAKDTSLTAALDVMRAALDGSTGDRADLRRVLASGAPFAGVSFDTTGEPAGK